MATGKISKRTVDAAKPGPKKQILWDMDLKGFGLKITPAGGKIYVYQYRLAAKGEADKTFPSTYTIGTHGSPWTPTTAREEAERVAILVAQGIDPQMQRQGRIASAEAAKSAAAEKAWLEKELGFEVVAERWLASLLPAGKSQNYHDTTRWAVRSYLIPVLGNRPITNITPDDIQLALNAIPPNKCATPLAVHDTAYAIFEWAKGTKGGRLVADNVVGRVDRPLKPKGRKRFLTDAELALVWLATGRLETVWASFYRLAILTGKRRSEVANMDWSELDQDAKIWAIPAERSKNQAADLVSLSDEAIAELDALAQAAPSRDEGSNGWPSTGFVLTRNGKAAIGNHSKMKKLVDASISECRDGTPIPHWVVHDLRRTIATGIQRLGVRFEVTEALLNHTGKARSGVAGIYQQHDWKEEKREALTAWANHVRQIVAVANATNVVPLERRA